MKVVIVEDAAEVADSIRRSLTIQWPGCMAFSTGRAMTGLELAERESPDLVVLDLALADGEGLDALRALKRMSDVPVLIVSPKGDEPTRFKGLELGADDYILKPFSRVELLARVRAVLRRSRPPELQGNEGVLRGGGLAIDLAAGRVFVEGREVALSATEWKLLSFLGKNAGRIIPMKTIAINVWGLNFVENSTIKMCVRRVRKKIGDDTRSTRLLRSHRGRGYSLEL